MDKERPRRLGWMITRKGDLIDCVACCLHLLESGRARSSRALTACVVRERQSASGGQSGVSADSREETNTRHNLSISLYRHSLRGIVEFLSPISKINSIFVRRLNQLYSSGSPPNTNDSNPLGVASDTLAQASARNLLDLQLLSIITNATRANTFVVRVFEAEPPIAILQVCQPLKKARL